jgi:hypothetical protein
MTHTMVTFRLHRTGVILVALGAFLLGILLFMAGCIAGMRAGVRLGQQKTTKQQTAGTSHLQDEAHASPTAGDRTDATTRSSDRSSPAPGDGL